MAETSFQWQENLCREQKAPRCTFVIFGASGDLAKRKLFPSLFTLFRKGLMDAGSNIIACARHSFDTDSFRKEIQFLLTGQGDSKTVDTFLEKITYQKLDYRKRKDFSLLEELTSPLKGLLIFYLALPSSLYAETVRNLFLSSLLEENPVSGRRCQVVFEKPFGMDLKSFCDLDQELKEYLQEHQIYRIDHYLGKETVQNIFLLRFANRIFESIWNRDHIDCIQITAAETLGVENRAGYFDQAGILRDMFQNHMLEMLSLVTMECPREFSADAVRDEKVKLIRSIRKIHAADAVRAQYESYTSEPGIAPDSRTETFAGLRLNIDSWRWQSVPIYLRAGKKLACRKTEIDIVFKSVPCSIFPGIDKKDLQQNILHLHIQPNEGMALTLQAKKAGPKLCMGALTLCYESEKDPDLILDAYARLLLDCQHSDQTLFIRSDVIHASWELFQELLDQWKKDTNSRIPIYKEGSEGPVQSMELLRKDGRKWIDELKENPPENT